MKAGDLLRLLRRARHWTRSAERRGTFGMSHHVPPVELADLLRQVPGKWVALRHGEIIEEHATLDELMFRPHDRSITDATVMRAPAEHEAEMVGLG